MTVRLFKAAEVCELVQVQPYVLRSWEKEFPGIGLQKGTDSARLYRQSDVDHVQRIKQLVFGEGLTVAGARRRLEETAPLVSAVSESEAEEVLEALGDDVRSRIAVVRDGLRELQSLLSRAPGASNGHGRSAKPAPRRAQPAAKTAARKPPARTATGAKASSTRRAAPRTKLAKRAAAKTPRARKKGPSKRKHARA